MINHNSDPLVHVIGGKKILMQVEFVKQRKTKSTSIKQRHSKITDENDQHNIKTRKIDKKSHNLNKNVQANILN
ncbi:214_t:CDS:2 [Dentiscutata erythropus]|uniref:214_t:CDS:1 n=1 Tax=Dentiscutata erythropus TaxID=1348616 RepID=A0A9N8VIC6_9GLOM|nr:214_t:CDS:2 [Dentiscutata erythropus]